ncbi:TraY domain-containing protein [Streptomyces sp. SID13031]|uniref:FitA-like ribbon-helix-helix domain-containing protein n=1 Tax=Streptomyces sp. SID13031 TaxID=2706046 RepID=UPI0013C8505B|nr:TraY domain-containing protein [Streptomyces sp. SID13031]NEA34648.1 TraY domain-containing protein [Streptomyces sp. SID13031]
MAAITVRNLDDHTKHRLRVRAARNGRSMEAEARLILLDAVSDEEEPKNFFLMLHEQFAAIGGVELDLPERTGTHRVIEFE